MISPVHSNSASAGEHENDWLTDGVNPLQKLLLWRRQIDAGAIAAGETFSVNVHLFALDARGETEHHDDEIGLPGGVNRVLSVLAGHAPDQTGFGTADGLEEFDLDLVSATLLEMHKLGQRVCGMMDRPFFGDQIVIDPKAESILTGEADQVVAGFWWNEDPGPAHGIILQQFRRDALIPPREIDDRVGSRKYRCILGIDVPEVLALKAVFRPGIIGEEIV